MTERGFKVQMRVLDVSITIAEENIRIELMLKEREKVITLIRLRFIDGKPFDIVTNYMPARLFPGMETKDFTNTSLYIILRNKYDVYFNRGIVHQRSDAAQVVINVIPSFRLAHCVGQTK